MEAPFFAEERWMQLLPNLAWQTPLSAPRFTRVGFKSIQKPKENQPQARVESLNFEFLVSKVFDLVPN